MVGVAPPLLQQTLAHGGYSVHTEEPQMAAADALELLEHGDTVAEGLYVHVSSRGGVKSLPQCRHKAESA